MANYQLQATIGRANEAKYMTYLYNALVLLQEQMSLTDEELEEMAKKEIGMTQKTFNKIMMK